MVDRRSRLSIAAICTARENLPKEQQFSNNFHRLDLTRQAGFVVTIYDEDGLRLAATAPLATPAEAFTEARKIIDNKVEGPSR